MTGWQSTYVMKKQRLTRLYPYPRFMLRSLSMPATAALETFFLSMREMPYIAPSAGIRRQSMRCRSFATNLVSSVSEEVEGEASPFSTCSMWSTASSLELARAMLYEQNYQAVFLINEKESNVKRSFDPAKSVMHKEQVGPFHNYNSPRRDRQTCGSLYPLPIAYISAVCHCSDATPSFQETASPHITPPSPHPLLLTATTCVSQGNSY
jgi:hypothetical protein